MRNVCMRYHWFAKDQYFETAIYTDDWKFCPWCGKELVMRNNDMILIDGQGKTPAEIADELKNSLDEQLKYTMKVRGTVVGESPASFDKWWDSFNHEAPGTTEYSKAKAAYEAGLNKAILALEELLSNHEKWRNEATLQYLKEEYCVIQFEEIEELIITLKSEV